MNFQRSYFLYINKILIAGFILCSNLLLTLTVKATDPSYKMDFDGDGKTDIAVYRPGERNVFPLPFSHFYALSSQTGQLLSYQWGRAYDIHTPADYDNDGKTDVGIFRWLDFDLTPSVSQYWISYTLGGHSITPFSGFGNIVSRNYFGDAKAEIALFDRYDISEDPINPCFIMAFFVLPAGTDFALKKDVINVCMSDGEYLTPAVGDYNNDGKSDIAVLVQRQSEPGGSFFKVWYSPVSPQYTVPDTGFYLDVEYPIPGDYDGDGKTDYAGSKNVNGERLWRVVRSSDGILNEFIFGLKDDYPVPGDYDGDGKTDIAVFRRSTSTWYITRSSDNVLTYFSFGLPTDIPLTLPNSNIYY